MFHQGRHYDMMIFDKFPCKNPTFVDADHNDNDV